MRNFKVKFMLVSEHEEIVPANDKDEVKKIVEYEYETSDDHVGITSIEEIDDE